MRSEWPEEITFVFTISGQPAPSVLIYASILSTIKNDYSIGPLLSDENGKVVLKASSLRDVIANEKRDYPMDYDGDLDDCNGFEIVVESLSDLKERFNRLRIYYPMAAENLSGKINICKNTRLTTFKKRWQLPIQHNTLVIELPTIDRPPKGVKRRQI